jgi:short-subunit dehydrogenase
VNFTEKYGSNALIAGASEGIGAAFAHALAARGMNVILVARREELLKKVADEIIEKYKVKAVTIACDLSQEDAAEIIFSKVNDERIDFLVYNAALSYIGPFLNAPDALHRQIAMVNMITPLRLTHFFGTSMVAKRNGAMVFMSSLAGFQGSGFLTTYAATKAFCKILGESLWYEWKEKGVDVIACCAGATATPGYINSNPARTGFFTPRVQQPEDVVEACLKKLGHVPSFIPGSGNRIASFFMQNMLSRKAAVKIMGDTTRKMYRIDTK